MIYATVGTMFLDFPRLIDALDAIARDTGEAVTIQIGMGKTIPRHCTSFDFKPHDEVLAMQRQARVIVCHAGIGSVIDALKCQRPFLVVPRLKRFHEHMSDHQMEIAEAVQRRGWGRAIMDVADLAAACASPPPPPAAYRPARNRLIASVREVVERVAQE